MALDSMTFTSPLRRRAVRTDLDFELLNAAVAQFDQGNHREAINGTLQHLFGKGELEPEGAPLSFVQGSSRITLRLAAGELSASVPLVAFAEGAKTTAALRFLLTRVSGSGQLYQPRLRGDEVYLEWSEKVSRVHPLKLIEILKRMPLEADENDDWMVDEFNVSPLAREPIASLSPEELVQAEAVWLRHWSDVEELMKEVQRKRSIFFLNEVSSYATHHLRAMLPIAGSLTARLNESDALFNDTDVDPSKRESTLMKLAREMKQLPVATLHKNLGHVEYAISPQTEGSPRVLSNILDNDDYFDTVQRLLSGGKTMEAAVAMFSTFSYLLSRCSWSEDVHSELVLGLTRASGKSWREAANGLIAQSRAIVERFCEGEPEAGDGEEEDEDAGGDADEEAAS
jgi:hypothetical protein